MLRCILYSLFLFNLVLVGTFLANKHWSASFANLKLNNPPGSAVSSSSSSFPTDHQPELKKLCPQVEVAKIQPPQTPALIKMDEYLQSGEFRRRSAELLSKSITYQTVSYDSLSDPDLSLDDPLYEHFVRLFHDFIAVEFPKIKKNLQLQHVNTHGLLYTWEGTHRDLKPTVLLSHLDIVSIEEATVERWTYNSWNGESADGEIWDGDVFDHKHTLVAILEFVEALLSAGFQPERTVLLSFNFDKEIGGQKGAVSLANRIKELYPDGAAVMIDEGSVQFEQWGADMVMIGVTEKDKMDLIIEIQMSGGHASTPHDAYIGEEIMSEILMAIENLNYHTFLSDDHPLLDFLVCAQQHAPKFPEVLSPLLDDRLAGNIPRIDNDTLAFTFVEHAGLIKSGVLWSLTTAKSVTNFQGGAKSISLPGQTISWSDIRVHIAETTNSIKNDISRIISPIAQKHSLSFFDFNDEEELAMTNTPNSPDKSIRVRAGGIGKAAKISPSKVVPGTDTPWFIVAGTTRKVLGEGITVVPGMSPGNTDARWYADAGVSDYIYRYSPGATLVDSKNMHSMDEATSVTGHVNGVRWYSEFIRNMDWARFDGEIKGEEDETNGINEKKEKVKRGWSDELDDWDEGDDWDDSNDSDEPDEPDETYEPSEPPETYESNEPNNQNNQNPQNGQSIIYIGNKKYTPNEANVIYIVGRNGQNGKNTNIKYEKLDGFDGFGEIRPNEREPKKAKEAKERKEPKKGKEGKGKEPKKGKEKKEPLKTKGKGKDVKEGKGGREAKGGKEAKG